MNAASQLAVGPTMGESRRLGLTGAEAEIRSSRWFRSANNSTRSTSARLKLQASGSRPELLFCSNPYPPSLACCIPAHWNAEECQQKHFRQLLGSVPVMPNGLSCLNQSMEALPPLSRNASPKRNVQTIKAANELTLLCAS